MRYIVIDADGLIINAIEWDGEAEWVPPEGGTAVQSDDEGEIGGTCIGGVYEPAPIPEVAPPKPTFEELVAEASTFDEMRALVLAQSAGS